MDTTLALSGLLGADASTHSRLLHAIFEHALDAIVIADDAGRWLAVNDAAVFVFGRPRAELLGRAPVAFEGPRGSFRVPRGDGTERVVEYAAMRDLLPGHQLAIVRDVTERVRAEELLRESERRHRRIIETMADGVWQVDRDLRITYLNSRMAAMLGTDVASALGKNALEFLSVDALLQARANLARRQQGLMDVYETKLVRADGVCIDVLVRAVPVTNAAGEFDGVIAVTSDVTDKNRIVAELKRTEEQLRQSQKMEALGRLAGGVAHDFNNLLSVILTYSSFIESGVGADDPVHDDVTQVREAGERAAALTRQLLTFSRRQVVDPQVLDVNDVLHRLMRLVGRVLGADVSLSLSLDPELGRVRVDPNQLEQVVMNLVVNARDAMPNGGVLSIETKNVELDADYAARHVGVLAGSYVMLAVSDTGVGMDAATQARMFEPFFTTKDGKGTGLGLSTVFGIVRQAGGTVWVYSEPGRGTSMKVYLPRTDAALTSSSDGGEQSVQRGDEVILLVEDEERVRAAAVGILKRAGYTVLDAANAGEALLIAEQHEGPIDLVLTDVVMPRLDGRRLVERLRALRPHLPVLFMSGYTDDAVVHHDDVIAGAPFLQKPFTPTSLAAKVRTVLDRARG